MIPSFHPLVKILRLIQKTFLCLQISHEQQRTYLQSFTGELILGFLNAVYFIEVGIDLKQLQWKIHSIFRTRSGNPGNSCSMVIQVTICLSRHIEKGVLYWVKSLAYLPQELDWNHNVEDESVSTWTFVAFSHWKSSPEIDVGPVKSLWGRAFWEKNSKWVKGSLPPISVPKSWSHVARPLEVCSLPEQEVIKNV